MPYRLTAADLAPPVYVDLGTGSPPWLRTQLPAKLGECVSDSIVLDVGLRLVYTRYTPTRDLWETSIHERERSALTVTLALEGRSSTLGRDGQRFDFIAGHSTVAVFASRVYGERRFAANRRVRQLRLIAEEPLLRQYGLDSLGRGVQPGHSARLSCAACTSAARHLADSLIHLHGRSGNLLEMQIAALGLLSEHTRHLLPVPAPRNSELREQERERMLRVRELLMQHFDCRLTLASLASRVGTNAHTLSHSFRAAFGTSVHRMLTDIRMQHARELLETGFPVSSVAYKVGYRHPASFSTAFSQYYGRVPKSVAGGW